MKALSKKEGVIFLPKIWTLFFSDKEDFWPNPFSNRRLRSRCLFVKGEDNMEMIVYFHLTKEEQDMFKDASFDASPIYLYGAYNQIDVCQMKSFGYIKEMTKAEKRDFMQLIKNRFDGKSVGDKLSIKLKSQEQKEELDLMQSGSFFRFDPIDYWYNTYQRG